MANDMDTATQLIDTPEVAEAPQVKTKKELKKERKEIKKHKKAVKKEAALHSAKTTKAYNVMISAISIAVIVSMIFCSISAIKFTMGMDSAPAASADAPASSGNQASTPSSQSSSNSSSSSSSSDSSASTPSTDTSAPSADADNDASADSGAADSAPAGDPADVNSKEGAVQLYKTAHAKVMSEATSVTRTLDNNTQYNDYLEVGGNSTLAGVASTLMGMFLKANEEPIVHTGADIAANFPPTQPTADGLTADMIGEYSVKDEGDKYIVKLALNSSEASPDLGDNAAHLVNIVEAKTVEEAAAGFVSFTGLRNEYIAPTVEATIDKASGRLLELHTVCPSYMKFDKATVAMIINVSNVGIGLQYETKWTVQY